LAFTLAETLIVMGIIGVVAALTLPNLNSSTGDKEKVAKVKKIYSNLNDAFGRAVAVYGPYKEWNSNITKVGGRLTEFMKLSKDCGVSTTGCFVTKIKSNSSVGDDVDVSNFYRSVLADGTSIALNNDIVYVDIDGFSKGANTASKDIFAFNFDSQADEILPAGNFYQLSGGSTYYTTILTCGCFARRQVECTSWVIMYDNMDYLKADSNGKCKNSSITLKLDTNTTCK